MIRNGFTNINGKEEAKEGKEKERKSGGKKGRQKEKKSSCLLLKINSLLSKAYNKKNYI